MKQNTKVNFIFLFIIIVFLANTLIVIHAENNRFEGKEDTYIKMCFLSNNSKVDNDECEAFEKYLEDKQAFYQKELDDIKLQGDDIKNNIIEYVGKITEYENEVKRIDEQIALLESEGAGDIDSLEEITEDIKEKMEIYDSEYNSLKDKLVKLQSYIGVNYQLQFLLNAESIMDFYLRLEQLEELYKSDAEKINNIRSTLDEIDGQKEMHLTTTESIEKQKQLLSDSKSISVQLKEQAKQILMIYKQQEADIVASQTKKIEDLDNVKEKLALNKTKIENLVPSAGWISPIDKSKYTISAGVWNYPESFGGGVHLGIDMAAANGTTIVAPANAVVLFSSNGCSKTGYYGDMCGSPGAAGGGNQIYLIMSIDNKLFLIGFAHLEYSSVIESGSVVEAGTPIARVGSTGNSTGNHTHVEMFYLGEGSDIQQFINTWDGDLSFGCNWGTHALANTCDTTIDKARCRVNAQLIMGL